MRRRAQRQPVETGSRNRKQLLISKARHRLNLLRFPRWDPQKLAKLKADIKRQNKTISEAELADLAERIRASSDYGARGFSKEKAAVLKVFLKREGIDVERLYGIYTANVLKYALESKNMPQVVATTRSEETQTLKKLRKFLRAWDKTRKQGSLE